jgi:phosphoglycerol transferase MdoB-like AlkP superfamily enzyme
MPALALCVQMIGIIIVCVQLATATGDYSIKWNSLYFDIILAFLVLVTSWGFFRRRDYAAHLFVGYIALSWLAWTILSGTSPENMDDHLIGMFFHLLVVAPYLVFSRRVEATFLLPPTNGLDRVLAAVSWAPKQAVLFLKKMRWFAILLFAAYLVVMMILNCMVRSLYIDGNLSETWKLLF